VNRRRATASCEGDAQELVKVLEAFGARQVEPFRHIDTGSISDIKFTPANSFVVRLISATDGKVVESQSNPGKSVLKIVLKTSEEIQLEGEEAETAWLAFDAAVGGKGTESTPPSIIDVSEDDARL
jgi:hypothetical protein